MDKNKQMVDRYQGFFILSIFPLLIGLTGLILYLHYSKTAKSPEPPLPSWEVEDFPAVLGNQDPGIRAYVVHCDRDSTIRISFDERESVKGMWSGSDAELSIFTPFSETLPGTTHTETWGSIITSQDVDPFNPWFEVTLSVDPETYHTWLTADTKLNIMYPQSSGSTFINQEESLEQEIKLLVITDEDLNIQDAHKKWKQANNNATPAFLLTSSVFLFLGIVLLAAGLINLVRYKRLTKSN